MIDRGSYRKPRSHKRRGSQAGGPLMLNIRVRHIRRRGQPRATKEQVKNALQVLLDTGKMPRGFQFMYVDWKNPDKFGGDWDDEYPPRNHSEDADEFYEHFCHAVQAAIRLAVVRPL